MSLELSGTTGVKGVAGSVSAPSIVGDDTNTGISFPSADTIKFSTGGVERMSITNSGVSGITAGITMADMWRVSSSFNGHHSAYVTSNWERVDTDGFGQLGTGMTESSGEFTFPSTGIYLIDYRARGSSSSDYSYAGIKIYTTTDNSNYGEAANSYGNGDANTIFAASCFHMFDVTDTSTHKAKFQVEASVTTNFSGGSSGTSTGVLFIRLGDT